MPITVHGAAGAQHAERLLGGLLQADGLEGVVHAAAGELAHLADRVALRRVDGVGGAELAGQLELRLEHVDGDDLAGAGDGGALDAVEADAAAPDHGDGGAGLDLGGVEHRADAGGDAAADQRGPVERHVLADLHEAVLVDEHLLGERAHVEQRVGLLAGVGEPRLGARRPPHGVLALAQRQVAGEAGLAVAAEHRQAGDHVVAGLHVGDLVADRLDDRRPTRGRARRAWGRGTCPP